MNGIKDYHKTVLPEVKINNQILTAPPKIQVNKDNIGFPLKQSDCILKSFQRSTKDDNPYHQFYQNFNRLVRNNIIRNEYSEHKISPANFTAFCVFSNSYCYFSFTGNLYLIIHDGIQKFSRELNNVITRHTTPAMDPLILPWKLTEIQGGPLNASELCDCIFNTMKSIQPVQNAADAAIVKSSSQYPDNLNVPHSPSYFKVCQFLHFSEGTKTIQLIMLNWPTTITADGCSTNMSAGNKLMENLRLATPFMRYDYSNKENNWEKALFTLSYRCLHRSYCISILSLDVVPMLQMLR